jgi:hypothetical protein
MDILTFPFEMLRHPIGVAMNGMILERAIAILPALHHALQILIKPNFANAATGLCRLI